MLTHLVLFSFFAGAGSASAPLEPGPYVPVETALFVPGFMAAHSFCAGASAASLFVARVDAARVL